MEDSLYWLYKEGSTQDDVSFHNHYLCCKHSSRCYAVINGPEGDCVLFKTDLFIEGEDRNYLTLEAAQSYAELRVYEYLHKETDAILAVYEKELPTPKRVAWWKRYIPVL